MSANGQLTAAELTLVQSGTWLSKPAPIYLRNDAAVSYKQLIVAYRKETGRTDGEIAEPDGGYRSLAVQAEMRADWYAKNWARHNLDPNSKAPPAPAGQTPHGLGICADIYGVGFQWFIDNGHRFGWSRTLVAENDLHHFQFNPAAFAGGGVTPLRNTKENDMLLFHGNDGATPSDPSKVYAIAGPGVWDRYSDGFKAALEAQLGPAIELNDVTMASRRAYYSGGRPVALAVPAGGIPVAVSNPLPVQVTNFPDAPTIPVDPAPPVGANYTLQIPSAVDVILTPKEQ